MVQSPALLTVPCPSGGFCSTQCIAVFELQKSIIRTLWTRPVYSLEKLVALKYPLLPYRDTIRERSWNLGHLQFTSFVPVSSRVPLLLSCPLSFLTDMLWCCRTLHRLVTTIPSLSSFSCSRSTRNEPSTSPVLDCIWLLATCHDVFPPDILHSHEGAEYHSFN